MFINSVKFDISQPRYPDGLMFAGIHVTDGDLASAEAVVVPPVWYWHGLGVMPGYEQDQDCFRLLDYHTARELGRVRQLEDIKEAMVGMMQPCDGW